MRARLGALALYGAVAVVLTWPLCLHLTTQVLDDGTLDAFQFVWNLWWTRRALLDLHTSPFTTHSLFFPDGVNLFWHTLSFTTGLLSSPFRLLGDDMRAAVAAENGMAVFATVATATLGALLAREVCGHGGAAALAGLLLVAHPFHVRQLHTANVASLYWLLAALLGWSRLHGRRSLSTVAVLVLVVVALFFAHHEYVLMAVALLGYDLVYRLLRGGREGEPAWPGGALASLVLSLGAVAASVAFLGGSPPERPPFHVVVWNSADLTGLATPPWLRAAPAQFLGALYLGSAPLVLGVVAQVIAARQATRWNVAGLLCLLAALGPVLRLGPPTVEFLRASEHAAPDQLGWPLPYRLAYELIPGVATGRSPWRWVGAAHVCLAMAAACGMAGLAQRLARAGVWGTRLTVAGGMLVAGVSLAEALPHRLDLTRATAPSGYEVVRADTGGGAVLDLPSGLRRLTLGLYSSLYMAYQTEHRHPLVEGTVARLPATQRYVFQRRDFRLVEHPEIAYVVLHRPLFRHVYPVAPSIRLAREARREGELVFRDAELRVYRLRSSPPFSPAAR